jgi:monoamine oxidase
MRLSDDIFTVYAYLFTVYCHSLSFKNDRYFFHCNLIFFLIRKVKGGTQQISEKLLEQVLSHSKEDKFILNTALEEVKQNKQENLVCITTRNTQTGKMQVFKGKKVISSIPINQYISIKFDPELPTYKRNFHKFSQMGNYVKFIVTYKENFWRKNGYSGLDFYVLTTTFY